MKAATQQGSVKERAEHQGTLEQLQHELAELKAEALELQTEFASCGEKISQKQAQQRTLVVAARVRKDKSAQAEVDKLSEEVRVLQDANLQNYAAIEELSATVKDKEAALDREERRLHYGEAVALIERRMDGKLEARLLDLIEELRETAIEIDRSDSEIATALHKLSGLTGARKAELLREAQEFAYRQRARRNTISNGLKDVADTISGGVGLGGPAQAAQAFEKLARMLGTEGNLDGQAA